MYSYCDLFPLWIADVGSGGNSKIELLSLVEASNITLFCLINPAFNNSVFCSEQYRSGIARFLLGLYVAVLVNGVVFRHAHRLADGTIICHAHPYKSSPGTQFPNHAHSRDELIWLDGFANAVYANPDSTLWVALTTLILGAVVGGVPRLLAPFMANHVAFRHRGPPVHLV